MSKEILVPDYDQKCSVCEATPVVTIENEEGEIVQNWELCGPCLFGEADAIYPENWGEIHET